MMSHASTHPQASSTDTTNPQTSQAYLSPVVTAFLADFEDAFFAGAAFFVTGSFGVSAFAALVFATIPFSFSGKWGDVTRP
jgi:hypothetical protein